MNHDALFKMLLKSPSVLQGFFQAFVPEAARFIDFGVLEFVDKERFTIDQKKRTGDLLVKTRFRGKPTGFLIHLEHQAQHDTDLARRMLEYFMLDWREYDLPVYPIAVLSYRRAAAPDPAQLAVDFPNKRVLCFDFDVIDLHRMDAAAYVKIANPAALALAARMKSNPKELIRLTCDFFLSLANTRINSKDKELVAEFFSSYKPLHASQALQLETELGKVKPDAAREAVMNLTHPFIELGKQRGLQQGRQEGEVELVLRQLSRRLGALSAPQEKAIRRLTLPRIEALGEALLDFASPADLARWLRLNK